MRARPLNGAMPWWYARPFYFLLFRGFLLTIAALAAAIWVFISVPSGMAGLRDYNANTVQLIRERNHFFLVQPEWISGGAKAVGADFNLEWRWEMAEIRARWAVLFILWVAIVSYFISRYSKQNSARRPVSEPLKISH
jgi:hypothetical protein